MSVVSSASITPRLDWRALLFISLSLSIGWGIRGNYGHEYGAMIAGTLAGIAAALVFGREDWHKRVVYFGLFGGLGWAFGGSMSYMQVVSYTHSGHLHSQLYGFFGVFALGFLWAAPGGGGAALSAVLPRDRLTALVKPFCFVLAAWSVYYFGEEALVKWYERTFWETEGYTQTWFRQKSPFYWMDTDWLEVLLAITALCAYDLWSRKFKNAYWLPVLAVAGAIAGHLVLLGLASAGLDQPLGAALTRHLGDTSKFDPNNLLTNWPQFFSDVSAHLGWMLGALLGCIVYFVLFGEWRDESNFLMHLAIGWYICFLVFPVAFGIRMTPPRGDNWAGVLGVILGGLVYFKRYNLLPAAYATLLCGIAGGLGFLFMIFMKLFLVSFGNPQIVTDPETIAYWKHWQQANWHSLAVEQGAGCFYGIGLALAMAYLARSTPRVVDNEPKRRWTAAFAVFFILNVLLYINIVKNVQDFLGGRAAVPDPMTAPLFDSIVFSTWGWFNIHWLAITICTVALLRVHLKRGVSLVPKDPVGQGQLLYLIFLWAIVLGNYMKALSSFHEQRLGTEGIIFINGAIVTYMALAWCRRSAVVAVPTAVPAPAFGRLLVGSTVCIVVAAFLATAGIRGLYGDKHTGHAGEQIRFGSKATWKVAPNLKNKEHS